MLVNEVVDTEVQQPKEVLTKEAYERTREHHNTQGRAERYADRYVRTVKEIREMNCVKQALSGVPKSAKVLDLPCGAGRFSFFIRNLGYDVIGADYSVPMVNEALKKNALPENQMQDPIHFEQQDIVNITRANNEFQATLCNRLFHHYPTAELRRMALTELARVTSGPIIVSFFNSRSVSAVLKKIRNFIKGKTSVDRLPISLNEFKKDIHACGLKVEKVFYTRRGCSLQTYVKLVKA